MARHHGHARTKGVQENKTRGHLGTRSVCRSQNRQTAGGQTRPGVLQSEDCACAVCRHQVLCVHCVQASGPGQVVSVPQTEGIPKHYLTRSHVADTLWLGAVYPGQGRVLRTQYCLCPYTGNKPKEASATTSGHVFWEPPVCTVALERGPRKHTWKGSLGAKPSPIGGADG